MRRLLSSQVTCRKLLDLVILLQTTINDISLSKCNDQLQSFLGCRKWIPVELVKLNEAMYFIEVFLPYSHIKTVCRYSWSFADPPAIALNPLNATKEKGENFTWFCNATGNPGPNISWMFNGSHINIHYNPKIVFSKDKGKMTITNVGRTDSGEYQCMASNNIGNASSQLATFDVLCKYDVP